MVDWKPVFVRSVSSQPWPLKIDYSFNSPIIALRISSVKAAPNWRWAGWFHPILQISGPGIETPFTGASRRVYLRSQILRFDNLGLPYQGEFYPVGWLPDVTIIAWEPEDPVEEDVTTLLEEVKELQEKITGEELVLRNGIYREVPGEPDLIESVFVEAVRFDKCEVGRFRLIADERTISEPIIQTRPRQLIVTFTGTRQIEPGTIKTKITEL